MFSPKEVIQRLLWLRTGYAWAQEHQAVAELLAKVVLTREPGRTDGAYYRVPEGVLRDLLLSSAGDRKALVTTWWSNNQHNIDHLSRAIAMHRPRVWEPRPVRDRGRRGDFEIALGARPIARVRHDVPEPLRAALLIFTPTHYPTRSLGAAVQLFHDFIDAEHLLPEQLDPVSGQIWLDRRPYARLRNGLLYDLGGRRIDEKGAPL